MLRPPPAVAWVVALTIGTLGSGDPSVGQESIAALGNALDALVQAGQSSRAAEVKRLLDEMTDGSDPGQP